jgi:hypothetical protein
MKAVLASLAFAAASAAAPGVGSPIIPDGPHNAGGSNTVYSDTSADSAQNSGASGTDHTGVHPGINPDGLAYKNEVGVHTQKDLEANEWHTNVSTTGNSTSSYVVGSPDFVEPTGNFMYLADLVPQHESVGWGSYQINKNWYNRSFSIGSVEYDHGVFAHAPSDIIYHLEGKYRTFTGCVGLDDENEKSTAGQTCNGDGAMFQIFLDQYKTVAGQIHWEQVWSAQKFTGDQATCFVVNLEVHTALTENNGLINEKNAQRLRLVVDQDTNNECDHADWVNTKLFEDPVVDCQQLGSLTPESTSVGWGSYWVNRNWYQNGFVIAGARYSSGVFAHAPSELIYPLRSQYDSFSACVGLDDGDGHCGDGVDFQIWLTNENDNKALYRTITKHSQEAATCFSIDTKNRKTLTLVADAKINDDCDEAEWVNANVCREKPKPQDCVVGPWFAWGDCTKSCGTGVHTQQRNITVPEANGGVGCPALTRSEPCNEGACPIDCIVSGFGDWTTCQNEDGVEVTCGGGTQERTQSEKRAAVNGGKRCPATKQTRPCKTNKCPIDCEHTSFGNYSTCTRSCGGGEQVRYMRILSQEAYGGQVCPTQLSESRPCNTVACKVDCVMSAWGEWGDCSTTCGNGQKTRSRLVIRAASSGGLPCPAGNGDQHALCNQFPCPIDCTVTAWTTDATCSKTCGGGEKTNYRSIQIQSAFGGKQCPQLTKTESCDQDECPEDCVVASWSTWSACSKTCGGGEMFKERTVTKNPRFGGEECPHTRENRDCNMQSCPRHCEIGNWTAFTDCTKTCGAGTHTKTRNVTEGAFGGVKCPPGTMKFNTSSCNVDYCPIDCEYSGWSFWDRCSHTCTEAGSAETGSHTRTRTITKQAEHGGVACDDNSLTDTKDCDKTICPIDATYSDWVTDTQCVPFNSADPHSVTYNHGHNDYNLTYGLTGLGETLDDFGRPCGNGHLKMTRSELTPTQYGGVTSTNLTWFTNCSLGVCARKCVYSDWVTDPNCHAPNGPGLSTGVPLTCGAGKRYRRREVQVEGQGFDPNGTALTCFGDGEELHEQLDCHVKEACCAHGNTTCDPDQCADVLCDRDCVMNPWTVQNVNTSSEWTQCTEGCHEPDDPYGQQQRVRTIQQEAIAGGKACGATIETRNCNTHRCPVHCQLTDATQHSFTACSTTCGAGIRHNLHPIANYGHFGGRNNCTSYTEVACDPVNQACDIDCQYGPYTAWSACDKSCGGGEKTRTRSVLVEPEANGKTCAEVGGATDVMFCNDQDCNISTHADWATELNNETSHTNWTAAGDVLLSGQENHYDNESHWYGFDDWNTTYNNNSDGESVAATAYPTLYPTAYPTKAAYQDKCMNGGTEVDFGWHGAGAGNNWCNLCKCSRMHHSDTPSALHCQKKVCATKTSYGNICSHTKCHFVYNFEAQHRVMMVSSHHNETEGSHHQCAFNPSTAKCECRCAGELSAEHIRMTMSSFVHNDEDAPKTGEIKSVDSGQMELYDANQDFTNYHPICLDNQRRAPGTTVIRACLDSFTRSNHTSDTW